MLVLIALIGNAILVEGVFQLSSLNAEEWYRWACLTLLFLAFSDIYATLPSGAGWRLSMTLAPAALMLLPPAVGPLIALPGLVVIAYRTKETWDKYLLLFSHVALGIYVPSVVFEAFREGVSGYGVMLLLAAGCYTLHFLINRFISVLIIAYRKNRSIAEQLKLTVREIHWGYFTAYLISYMSALLCLDHGIFALVLGGAIQLGLFQSVQYYSKMHQWHKAALSDRLTGLENRIGWETFIHSGNPGLTGTLAVIDLNDFKQINDEYGHMAGDGILREVGEVLRKRLPEKARSFRYVGDEFVVFYPHPASEREYRSALAAMESIGAELTGMWKQRGLIASASIGAGMLPRDAATLQELFYFADKQMLKTKEAGKRVSV